MTPNNLSIIITKIGTPKIHSRAILPNPIKTSYKKGKLLLKN